MGRIINLNENTKERTQLSRSIVLALRELSMQIEINDKTRDLVAYVVLALSKIMATVERSVVAWEKRGYWLKADRYRMEWIWAETNAAKLRKALIQENWQEIALISAHIAEQLQSVKLPKRHQLGTPWLGARDKLKELEPGSTASTSSPAS